ncbi:MAG: tRNA uridine-5-carboxymethylaminomethyl(34) synthesis enzyme MnmG [Elusimicrobiota bacterium]|jgi:tRNA uridine 5-carboxymethylaminomethyl modification enzyme
MTDCDVLVVGAGHAGAEAALAAARLGCATALLTQDPAAAARMSCNPSIGGVAKGQMVRELDALGGDMGLCADMSALHYRALNGGKGAAVRSPRVQCDRRIYAESMQSRLRSQERLILIQGEAVDLRVEKGGLFAVSTRDGRRLRCRCAVLCAGTFLDGRIHMGLKSLPGGRIGEPAAQGLSESLRALGLKVRRFKTGTPPRLRGGSIDFSKLELQPPDPSPKPLSLRSPAPTLTGLPCWIGCTNEETHAVIRANLHRGALYGGSIRAPGPRYCPSVEDKVVKFPQRPRHQVFLEPESRENDEIYPGGLSTSLPEEAQLEFLRTISGLGAVEIVSPGYSIEYDYCPSTQLRGTYEARAVEGLFLAGQINGTTGYEEAAAQGLLAGINAAHKVLGREPFILGREEAYLGVMTDDLVCQDAEEPYRMFTARAEHRLELRSDNADLRLLEKGFRLGLVGQALYGRFLRYRETVSSLLVGASPTEPGEMPPWSLEEAREQASIQRGYEGYIRRDRRAMTETAAMRSCPIPEDFRYEDVPLLSEARQKLSRLRPRDLAQASRIPGVTPADARLLSVWLRRMSGPAVRSAA